MSDNKFFDKALMPQCGYCVNGRMLSGEEEVFCLKKGIKDVDDYCRNFKYDPLKRVPNSKDFGRDYKPEDFKL